MYHSISNKNLNNNKVVYGLLFYPKPWLSFRRKKKWFGNETHHRRFLLLMYISNTILHSGSGTVFTRQRGAEKTGEPQEKRPLR